jgi:hypothetical protein
MSAIYSSHRDPNIPPRWLCGWCFFIGCLVPLVACTTLTCAGLSHVDFTVQDYWPALAFLFAGWVFVVTLLLVVGTSACFWYDAEAATYVVWMSATFGGMVLVGAGVVGLKDGFSWADWLYAFTTFYYLAATAILHARLASLSRRYERIASGRG